MSPRPRRRVDARRWPCLGPGCPETVGIGAPHFCPSCSRRLPSYLRHDLEVSYMPSQEDSGVPNMEHAVAIRRSVAWLERADARASARPAAPQADQGGLF